MRRESSSAEQVRHPSWKFIMSCQSFLSAQQLSSALIPPSLPTFITPFSPLWHTPPTLCVVYHVRWNRVSLAVNLENGVTSETPGTLALISDCNVTENDEHFQQLVTLASAAAHVQIKHQPSPKMYLVGTHTTKHPCRPKLYLFLSIMKLQNDTFTSFTLALNR